MATLDATTLERVRLRGKFTSDDNDVHLRQLIRAVSDEIERFIGRDFISQARTEQYTGQLRGHSIFLRQFPVTSITDVRIDSTWQFGTETIVDNDSGTAYRFSAETGELYFKRTLTDHFEAIQVNYTGGMAATTQALIASYPTIPYAADMQVLEEHRRRNNPGTRRRGGAQGGQEWHETLALLPRVKELLFPFKRMVVGAP